MLTNALTKNLVAALMGLIGLVVLSLFLLTATAFLYPEKQEVVDTNWERSPTDEQPAGLPAALTDEQVRGKLLFTNNCAQCHAVTDEVVVGPGLKGVTSRTPDRAWLHRWIRNSSALIATGDAYAVQVYTKFNKVQMSSFPSLTDADIDAMLAYIDIAPTPSSAILR